MGIKTFSDLVGHTITSIERTHDELIFTLSDGEKYKLYHDQDCCENVWLEDVTGDFGDLIGVPILKAEEASSSDKNPPGVPVPDYQDSFTWTFYHLVTFKGPVTLRWYGESNGYYSESVNLAHWNEGWIGTQYE